MSWDLDELGDLSAHTYLVTGANSGIGLETARELVARGAHVLLGCRDVAKGERARADIAGRGTATVLEMDLSDLDSVRAAAAKVDRLDALVCNAGVMGGHYMLTAQGFERQMGTNHLGHADLVTSLWPQLSAAGGRVVLVSSIAARGGRLTPETSAADLMGPERYISQSTYRDTKQANLLFAMELHRRSAAAGSPVTAVACHPGVSSTNLFARNQSDSGRPWLAPVASVLGAVALQSARAGALPTLRALAPTTPSGSFVGPRAFGQVRGAPHLLDVYPSGANLRTAARLWDLTEELLGRPLPLG
ncbi:MAG TPA: SDR family NAD(P)-dependent oxidoreductase [Mycobacteriales bacterium]|nr:SDR family NAD(P)-dependent oxidoreductase [Mycobacteriales bacterium]